MIRFAGTDLTDDKELLSGREDQDDPSVYCPSQEQIRRACREIQQTWSPREFRERSVRYVYTRWTPPRIEIASDLRGKIQD